MKKITICGSMSFFQEMEQMKTELESSGLQVFIPTKEEIDFFSMSEFEKIKAKKQYIQEHMDRINSSDSVVIANYTKNGIAGYVGPNTLIEMAFAKAFNKPIYLLMEPEKQPALDEIRGFDYKIIKNIKEII